MDVLIEIIRSLFATFIRQWPGLIGTFYAVLLGGMATLGIARWQIGEERKGRTREERQFLSLLVEHVNREITFNGQLVHDLIRAFERSPNARLEVWDWAVAIVGGLSVKAHDDLYRTGLQRYLPPLFEEQVQTANATTIEVRNKIRQARANHIFNDTYLEDGTSLNQTLYGEVSAQLPGVFERLKQADAMVDPKNLPWTIRGEPRVKIRRRKPISVRIRKRLRRR